MDPLEAATDQIIAAARVYLDGAPHERTGALKEAAHAIMRARSTFLTADGNVDWLGRSSQYRALLAYAVEASPIPKARRTAFLAATRHHVSALLHATLSSEEIADLGLSAEDPAARMRKRRAGSTGAQVDLLAGTAPIASTQDVVDAATLLVAATNRLRPAEAHPHVLSALDHLAQAVHEARLRVPQRGQIDF